MWMELRNGNLYVYIHIYSGDIWMFICMYIHVYKLHRNAKILPLVPVTRGAMLPGTRDCYQTAAAVHRQA